MEKCIPVDRLARPDNWVVLRSRQVREIREEQGLEGGRPMPFDEESLRSRLHGIYTGELQAMEAAGRTLFDFPDAPWEFQLDMARQVWDEARHSEIFQRLVEYMGGHPGDYVETEILWRCTQAMDPAARVAGINRGLEGLACDVFDQLIRIAQRNGDEVIERSVDYVLADEITHVRMGSQWMRKLDRGRPRAAGKGAGLPGHGRRGFQFPRRTARAGRYRERRRASGLDRERSADAGGIHRRRNPAADQFRPQERRLLASVRRESGRSKAGRKPVKLDLREKNSL